MRQVQQQLVLVLQQRALQVVASQVQQEQPRLGQKAQVRRRYQQ
jgi:hypothetical protein